MAKLCHQCFHTPRGICGKHNDKDEHSRKFCEALTEATLPWIKASAEDIYMPMEQRYPWLWKAMKNRTGNLI